MIHCGKCDCRDDSDEMFWGDGIDEEENEIIGDYGVVCRECFYKLEKKYNLIHKKWNKLIY